MLNIVDDVVSRVEHSRLSYNSQTEDFQDLNTNLQTYLNDMRRIDDDNRQLQENINQIRANYLLTLANHLKRLPKDFREQSDILTGAHLERYRSKSRARRFLSEREELKKRIAFLSNNDKEQVKRLNQLQKQDRLVQNELKSLTDQLQNLHNYVQNERQTHRRAMDKVDYLQSQLEQICVERSKTEFEVQTLREEVQLMQTTKEFLNDEHQTILSTQTEANEYFLSCLNQSISRIRDDFQDLQKTQVKQMENEYKQMNQVLQEAANVDETTITHHRTNQIEYEKLQDEHRSAAQDLKSLNDHNQALTERILAMENDLYAIRSERMGELLMKDQEFERSQMELRTLNEKLNYLAEYDRNLKFELTLYRGVLESEYRRKQQQVISNQQLVRPGTLKTRSNKTSPASTNCQHLEPIVEKNNEQTDGIRGMQNSSDEQFDPQENPTELLKSPNSITLTNQQSPPENAPMNDQQLLESSLVNQQAEDSALPEQQTSSAIALSPEVLESVTRLSEDHETLIESAESEVPTNEGSSSPKSEDVLSSSIEPLPEASRTSNDEQTFAEEQSTSIEASSLPTNTSTNEEVPVNGVSFDPSESQQVFPTFPNETLMSKMEPEMPNEVQQFDSTLVASEDQEERSTSFQSSLLQTEEPQEVSSSAVEEEEVEQVTTIASSNEEIVSETESGLGSPTDQSSSTITEEQQTASSYQQSSNTPSQDDPSISTDVDQKVFIPSQEQPFIADLEASSNQETNQDKELTETSDKDTINVDPEEQTNSLAPDTNEIEIDTYFPTDGSVEASNSIEHETTETANVDSSSSTDLPAVSQEETKSPRKSSDQNQSTSEELVCSSDQINIEENTSTAHVSSTSDSNGLIHSTNHPNEIEEVDSSTSPNIEEKDFEVNIESDLEASLQDLRYVYRQLINEEELVEINDTFSEKLTDRLEFDDNLIRTMFDKFLKKYIIQPANEQVRSNTLDWIEFRDILFPIITGRYTERHVRRLFDLFDTSRYGYLSMEEISELLELLQMNNTADLVHELDINQNGRLTMDEFIGAIKETDDGKNNILSDAIEETSWYNQYPTDADDNDTDSISLEVPIAEFPPKVNKEMRLLARIFKRMGVDVDQKQLDSHKPTLLMKLTNEFVHNNIPISTDDLQFFIEVYLTKKQNSDRFITWTEFRDVFSPFVNDGMLSQDDLSYWFDLLDRNQQGQLNREQILSVLRLLQIPNPNATLDNISANKDSWTFGELISNLTNLDETKVHLLPNNELTSVFDLDWFTKNIF